MNIADVQRGERDFTITWADQTVAEIPFIWLRDNDPDELHPDTRERVFDLTSVDIDVSPESFQLNSNKLIVQCMLASGERHVRGYYIEKNEVDSRIRVLARQTSQEST